MSKDELEKRRDIIAACLWMNSSGLNQGTSGNISVRHGDSMLISPSGVPYEQLEPDDIVAMTLSGEYGSYVATGANVPSSEWRFHLDIMRARPDVGAIVHTHSLYATVLGCARKDIPPVHYMIAAAGGPSIRCSRYATYGTAELSDGGARSARGAELLHPRQSRHDRDRPEPRQGAVAGGRARDDRQAILPDPVHWWAGAAGRSRDRARSRALQELRAAPQGAAANENQDEPRRKKKKKG